jgi:hypothetical protein
MCFDYLATIAQESYVKLGNTPQKELAYY